MPGEIQNPTETILLTIIPEQPPSAPNPTDTPLPSTDPEEPSVVPTQVVTPPPYLGPDETTTITIDTPPPPTYAQSCPLHRTHRHARSVSAEGLSITSHNPFRTPQNSIFDADWLIRTRRNNVTENELRILEHFRNSLSDPLRTQEKSNNIIGTLFVCLCILIILFCVMISVSHNRNIEIELIKIKNENLNNLLKTYIALSETKH
jgi:hypothetical protein